MSDPGPGPAEDGPAVGGTSAHGPAAGTPGAGTPAVDGSGRSAAGPGRSGAGPADRSTTAAPDGHPATVPFSAFMADALYGDAGFYETGGRAGRRGDFVTSPEVGPLFGAVLARTLDAWWDDLGRPDPFLVDEHGAGPGTLARTLLVAAPRCAPALRLTLVERTASQRARHTAHLPHVADPDLDPRWTTGGAGPLVTSVEAAPGRPAHVIVANELLDNLPFDRFERTADGWDEVRVDLATDPRRGGPDASRSASVPGSSASARATGSAGQDGSIGAGRATEPADARGSAPTGLADGRGAAGTAGLAGPREVLIPAGGEDAADLRRLVPDAPAGARVPLQREASTWVNDRLADLVPGGRLLVLDYGVATTAELSVRPESEWLRTYSGQDRSGPPLDEPGSRDITAEVCLDQLAALAGPPTSDESQADWLRRWGIDDLVAEGRASWEAGGPPLDVTTLRLRSRIAEAEVLLDPAGLGTFRVWEWRRR